MLENTEFICTFFNNIHGLETDSNEIQLSDEHRLFIFCNEDLINETFDLPVKLIVGHAQYDLALELKKFVYCHFSLPDDNDFDAVHVWLLKMCTLISNSFWLVKDSSIRFNTGHLICRNADHSVVKSNTADAIYTNCIGEKISVYYNEKEIIEALNYFDFIFNITLNQEKGSISHTTAEANRVNRAYYFIDLARKAFDIGTKISLHCSAFECLFSVSNAELRHRLSETIANLIGKNYDNKLEIYNQVKEIYDLRSSVTHGSGISKSLINNDHLKLKNIGANCDKIMRECLQKIISDQILKDMYFRNDNKEIGNYFTELLFT